MGDETPVRSREVMTMDLFGSRRAPVVAPVVVLVLLAGRVAGAAPVEGPAKLSAESFSWTDVGGHRYGSEEFSRHPATVFLFWSSQCPIANLYVPRIIELAREYGPKGVGFFLVNSNVQDSRATVVHLAKARALPFPAVKDAGTALADRLGAQMTPQAVIVDAAGATCYRGRIDDNTDRDRVTRRDLREALDALLAGKSVPRPRTLPFGCTIFREPARAATASAANVTTYTRDVARILNENCVACHRKGEVAPFALETYPQARAWSRQIKEYTARRLMPPWKADPGYGSFRDARYLTEKQIALLARWADAGAPHGAPREMPPAPQFLPPDAWPLGTPDVLLQPVGPYHLAAEGKDVYRNFVLPIDFKEDRYVEAMDFKPDNRAIVHHIVAYLDPTAKSAKMDGRETEPGYTVPGVGIGIPEAQWGDVWVPGNTPRRLPAGTAVKIPAGAKIVMQVHYHKTGKPEADHSRMALYFARGPVETPLSTWALGNVGFVLEPGGERQEVRASLTLPTDVRVWSIFPHMHMLGREMKVTATLPDGTVKPLVWVRDWDFNWQMTYQYQEPVALPRGTRVELVAVYDNSATNPRQTADPPRKVRFGEQTTDEMCYAFLSLTEERKQVAATNTPAAR
jgi:mono/diheme cytochrome c family protein